MVATPVRAADAGDDVRERALDQRRLAHGDERRLVGPSATRRAKWSERPIWLSARTLTPYVAPTFSGPVHPRAPVDGDEHERRLERHRHERVRRHPVHLTVEPPS